jgi:hypothetical protein
LNIQILKLNGRGITKNRSHDSKSPQSKTCFKTVQIVVSTTSRASHFYFKGTTRKIKTEVERRGVASDPSRCQALQSQGKRLTFLTDFISIDSFSVRKSSNPSDTICRCIGQPAAMGMKSLESRRDRRRRVLLENPWHLTCLSVHSQSLT